MTNWYKFLSAESQLRFDDKEAPKPAPKPKDAIDISGSVPPLKNYPLRSFSIGFQIPSESPDAQFNELTSVEIAGEQLLSKIGFSPNEGLPETRKVCKDYIKKFHKKAGDDWDVVVQTGSTNSIDSIFRLIVDPGDSILVDEISYMGLLKVCKYFRVNIVPVKFDINKGGSDLEYMESLLANWDETKSPKPKCYYCTPNGSNPTGLDYTLEMKKKLLEISSKYDFLVIEDDVFYHLNPKPTASLFEMDQEGRVLRIDSFSKCVMPGMRISLVSCNKYFAEYLTDINHFGIGFASPFAQITIYEILEKWQSEGFDKWVEHINEDYVIKREALMQAFDEFMPHELMEYSKPKSGMAMWIQLKNSQWPKKEDGGNWNVLLENKILDKVTESGVLFNDGRSFMVDPQMALTAWRLTYTGNDVETNAKAIETIAQVIKDTHEELYG